MWINAESWESTAVVWWQSFLTSFNLRHGWALKITRLFVQHDMRELPLLATLVLVATAAASTSSPRLSFVAILTLVSTWKKKSRVSIARSMRTSIKAKFYLGSRLDAVGTHQLHRSCYRCAADIHRPANWIKCRSNYALRKQKPQKAYLAIVVSTVTTAAAASWLAEAFLNCCNGALDIFVVAANFRSAISVLWKNKQVVHC